jgi:hypothetical protein
MEYSYARAMTSCDLIREEHGDRKVTVYDADVTPVLSWQGKYVAVTGLVTYRHPHSTRFIAVAAPRRCCCVYVWLPAHHTPAGSHQTVSSYSGRMVGRVEDGSENHSTLFIIDTTASRWHGASIAGLVVGAMGVFVFAVALKAWLNQRGAFHVETAEGDT